MILTIVRGLPGSGKSTFAKTLNGILLEADMFCYQNDKYVYSRLGHTENHALCLKMAKQVLKHGSDVIVGNTFTTKDEMKDYLAAAKAAGAKVKVFCMKSQYKSTKDIPNEIIEKMRERFEDYKGETPVI